MSKTLNKCITVIDYFDKNLFILADTGSDVSLFSFTAIIVTPAGIASVSIGLVFPVANRIVIMFLKTMKIKKIEKAALLARSNYILFYTLHSIEKISKALTDS